MSGSKIWEFLVEGYSLWITEKVILNLFLLINLLFIAYYICNAKCRAAVNKNEDLKEILVDDNHSAESNKKPQPTDEPMV